MKEFAKRPSLGKGRRHRKVFALIGSIGIMAGNYVFIPSQVLAVESSNEIAQSQAQEALSTLATNASEVPIATSPTISDTKESQELVVETATSQMKDTALTQPTTVSPLSKKSSPPPAQANLQKKEEKAAVQNTLDWTYGIDNGRAVISSYSGNPKNIIVPAEIEGFPVQIDLNTVLGIYLKNTTETFTIESAQDPAKAVKLIGTLNQLFYNENGAPIRSIAFGNADISKLIDIRSAFENCKNLESLDVAQWDTSTFDNFSRIFAGCSKLSAVDISNWKTDSLTFMAYMFRDCSALKEIDVDEFDTSKVTSTLGLFEGCESLGTLDLSSWDTSSLEYISNMFSRCMKLTSLDLSSFDTSKGTSMIRLFSDCSSLTSLNLSSWSTEKNPNMYEAFIGCEQLDTLTLSKKFQFTGNHCLRNLPAAASGTSSRWVKDNYQASYDTTEKMISAHEELQDDTIHTYTIREKHVLSFDTDGGSKIPASQSIFTGKLATDPQYDGKKVGYRFAGWLLEGQPFVFGTHPIDQPLTLKANWQSNRYSVKFDSNGGSGTMNDQSFVFDEEKNLSANAFTKKGYCFIGWNTERDGRGEKINDQQLVKNLSVNDGDTVTLYAQWEMEKYQVSFESKGGSELSTKTYTIEKGITNFEIPTRKGYDFAGWYEGNQKIESIPTGQTGDRTLTAQWTPKIYQITFEDESLPSQTYTIESRLTLPLSTKKRTGYHFVGWEVKEVLSQVLTPTVITEIQPGRTGNLLLKANWRANSYVIHYDANGGTGTMNQQVLTYNQTVKLAKNTFTKDREQFVGWNTKKDGSGTAYSNEQEILNLTAENNGTVTLFAQWKSTTAALQDLVTQEKTKNRDKNRYTTESWSNYEKALKEAEEVLAATNDLDKHQTALVNLQNAIAKLTMVTPQIVNYTKSQPVSTKQYPTAKRYPLTGFINDPNILIVGIASVSIALAGWNCRRDKKTKQ